MSLSLETANRGEISNFGFWGTDVSNVGMGELPKMPLPEFCKYATETVIDSLPYATSSQLSLIHGAVNSCESFLTMQNGEALRLDSVVEEVKRPIYHVNPFCVNPHALSVNIGEAYEGIGIATFARFTLRVIGGGIYGWGGKKIPPDAIQSLRLIRGAAQSVTPIYEH